jgi:hypothetical protein
MKKLKKYLTVGFTAMMVVTAAGCSGSTTTSSTTSTESTGQTTNESTDATKATSTQDASKSQTATDTTTQTTSNSSVVFGKVTAIDGTSVTLALGEMPQGNGMGNGEAPAATDNKTAQSSANTTSTNTATPPSGATKPDATGETSGNAQGAGQAPTGEKPSGEAPSRNGQAPDMSAMFEESGETKTITIEDESLIKIMSGGETTTGSLSDIAVDSILAIEYDNSDNITSITIQSATK